jgi:hypothetical protein
MKKRGQPRFVFTSLAKHLYQVVHCQGKGEQASCECEPIPGIELLPVEWWKLGTKCFPLLGEKLVKISLA